MNPDSLWGGRVLWLDQTLLVVHWGPGGAVPDSPLPSFLSAPG